MTPDKFLALNVAAIIGVLGITFPWNLGKYDFVIRIVWAILWIGPALFNLWIWAVFT